jgi:hypothetical protein
MFETEPQAKFWTPAPSSAVIVAIAIAGSGLKPDMLRAYRDLPGILVNATIDGSPGLLLPAILVAG